MPRQSSKARRNKARQRRAGHVRLTRNGYAFVNTPEGEFFILPSRLNGAMEGDHVQVAQVRDRRRGQSGQGENSLSGAVTRILWRNHQTVIGELMENDGLRVVRPLDSRNPYDVFVDIREVSKPAKAGDIVVVRLTTWPSRIEVASGYIEEVIGELGDSTAQSEIICRKYEIRTVFPDEVIRASSTVGLADALASYPKLNRRDLTDLPTFTVDPDDAKDFDDALSLEYVGAKTMLGIHIADVSAFVPLGNVVDTEARERSTSVYLPDRVIPMLPEQLSNELCSLKPDEDRLAMTVMIELDSDGQVTGVEFYPSVIRSVARLSYDQVDAFLSDSKADSSESITPEVGKRLRAVAKIATKLASRRKARGAIDFDSEEVKPVLDDSGKAVDIVLRKTTPATSLVEEAMILANEQVASFMMADSFPMIYRVHDEPQAIALEEATAMLTELGLLPASTTLLTASDVQKALTSKQGRPEHALISNTLLRAMQRAVYSSVYTGHYGLASAAYCHFTSPIRRYPDLMVHHLLKQKLSKRKATLSLTELSAIADGASTGERAAEAATREANNQKLVEYMSDFVGESFDVLIIGASGLGLFVRELKTTVEGLIPKESLPHSMYYDEEFYCYTDPNSKQSLTVGQMLRAELIKADAIKGWLDFKPLSLG
jgi:ribonuclease R